ncbi:MAG: Ig domain-containing protein, partial [Ilumatobacter sp.]|uniref:putative Ig domain-containing protein n=1 Tax=Ilumatobacter sp. TaxID=1967498 RepID=UPI003C7161A6
MSHNHHRLRRTVSGAVVAAIALGGSLVGLPGIGSSPIAEAAALQTIPLEAIGSGEVALGQLASRSQRGPVTIGGIGPYTITGTDSITNDPYTFVTDANYSSSVRAAYGYESVQRPGNSISTTSNTNTTYDGRTGVTELRSSGGCDGPNLADGFETYCGVFGPEVYSEPFDASIGQSVSFDWSAVADQDDYEIYAYLVEVTETGTPDVYDYGTPASHTQLTYGRGRNQTWITASGDIPNDGSYRFRFVNGTYDATGGFAVGSVMYIDGVVRVGLSNPIDFPQPGDTLLADGTVTLAATATSPGPDVNYQSITSNICTVSGSTVTLVANGVCSIIADHPGDGVDYVPAASVTRSFQVLAAATAPTNNGLPLIQGTTADGETVTGTLGSWGDGGSPITNITTEWQNNGSAISGVSGDNCILIADPSSTLTYVVTQTNAEGSTTATSAGLSGYTCGVEAAPIWIDEVLGEIRADVAFSDEVAATGVPTPTYSVTAGTLPDGLTLSATTGAITGTPTTPGAYDFTVTADNGVGSPITSQFTGTVRTAPVAPVFTDETIGAVRVAIPFTDGVLASGDPAATYSVTAGSLPNGLVLNAASGAITGTPTTMGAYDFTITATNTVGTDTTQFTGNVEPEPIVPVFTDVIIGTLTVGTPVNNGVVATGVPKPTYSVTSGTLPAGLTLNSATGAITGTPTTAGPYNFTISADNGFDPAVAQQFSGTIAKRPIAPTFTDSEIKSLVVGTPFNDGLSATGEPAPTYSVSAGALPAGLTLNPATGAITGTPTTAGPYDFTIRASNGVGTAVTKRFTGGVAPKPGTPTTPTIVITPPAGPVDEPIVVTGGGFLPNSSVEVVVGGNVTITTADNDGNISVEVLPPTDVDDYDIEIRGVDVNAGDVEVKRRIVTSFDGTPVSVPVESGYMPLTPTRVLDTRAANGGTGRVDADTTVRLAIDPDWNVPDAATAVVLNVTAVAPVGGGYLTVYSCDTDRPLASVVNYDSGRNVPNLVVISTGNADEICVYTFERTHLVIDLNGYFGPELSDRLSPQAPQR